VALAIVVIDAAERSSRVAGVLLRLHAVGSKQIGFLATALQHEDASHDNSHHRGGHQELGEGEA
jgi:hypothetical protein